MTIQITTLANGLRVATDPMPDAESVALGVWVNVGTRHEPWTANGVAHFAEHMVFKGTRHRSAYALSATIEKNGGMINAHTTREETAYYARVLPEDADMAADIIADMLQRSVFDPKELDRERQVILQEIGRDQDTPEDHVFDLLHQAAFPGQRLGRSVLGEAKVVERMPRDAVADYVKRHYHAGNLVMVGAGKITHEAMVTLAKRHFGRLASGKPPRSEAAHIKSGEIRLAREAEQLNLILAFPGPGLLQKKATTVASLLGVLLGGGASSRLFQKVREQRGLVYTISAGHMAFRDTGLFNIYAGTDPARVPELIPVVCRELRSVAGHITPSELKRAKAQIRADKIGRASCRERV